MIETIDDKMIPHEVNYSRCRLSFGDGAIFNVPEITKIANNLGYDDTQVLTIKSHVRDHFMSGQLVQDASYKQVTLPKYSHRFVYWSNRESLHPHPSVHLQPLTLIHDPQIQYFCKLIQISKSLLIICRPSSLISDQTAVLSLSDYCNN